MDQVIARHKRIILQCSGGRDSMSTLFLMRPWWAKLTVLWCNTGAQYPETIEVMRKVCEMVPHFIEVTTDQPASVSAHGYPADVVPIAHSGLGKMISDEEGLMVRPTWDCCAENIWIPMHRATLDFGATLVIRGQRLDDRYKAPLRSGDVFEGIEYLFPVEAWTRGMCDEYLREEPDFDVPDHFDLDHSSLDCWSCTGYSDKSLDRALHMRDNHPARFEQYITLVGAIARQVEEQFKPMRSVAALKE